MLAKRKPTIRVSAPEARTYNGRLYASKAERDYAEHLDIVQYAGLIEHWEPQVVMPLIVNGKRVCNYIVDFKVRDKLGSERYVEIKGYDQPDAKLKRDFFVACYPDVRLDVLFRVGNQFLPELEYRQARREQRKLIRVRRKAK